MKEITEKDLLEALVAHAAPSGGEGFRVTEIADATGIDRIKIDKLIRIGIANGKIRRAKKRIVTNSGHYRTVPSYVLVNGRKK